MHGAAKRPAINLYRQFTRLCNAGRSLRRRRSFSSRWTGSRDLLQWA